MLTIILVNLLDFTQILQCPFSGPGCNIGSHTALSCHVFLVSFILKHYSLVFLLRPMILPVLASSFVKYSFIWIWCFLMIRLKLCMLVSFSMHHTRRLDVSLPVILTWVTQVSWYLSDTLWWDSLRLRKYAICLHT